MGKAPDLPPGPPPGPPGVLPHRYAMVAVGQVQPHPANPNVGDVDAIAESIEGVGFWGALVVHEATGNILVGSHRWAAAQTSGLGELPALVVECDEETAERIMVGDNEFAKMARWDLARLVAVLNPLAASPAGLVGTGFGEAQLAELVAAMNPAPPDFRGYDDDLPTSYRCPSCGYEWSGQARPGGEPPC